MTSVSGDREVPAAATASSVDGGTERCPRCGSHNTKFCYYNNYNLTQPRHFCKACRRYWTLGGSIRDVPIGGSTRSSGHRSKQQTSGRPGSVFAAPSSSSGRRLLPSQGPATTYTSPSSSSSSSPPVNSGAPSIIPISEVPNPESTTTNESGAMDEVGVFTSLLTEPPPAGFMLLRDPFLPGFDDFSLELGLAGGPTGTANQLSLGMGTGVVAWPSFGDDGGAGLMPGANGDSVTGGVRREGEASRAVPGGAELVCGDGGDCFGWPELAISATPGERSALQ